MRLGLVPLIILWLPALAAAELPPIEGEERTVTVSAGQDLYKVAHEADLAMEHVAWANGRPAEFAVAAGTELTLPLRRILPANPPADGMVLNLPERGVYVFQGGQFVEFFPVAIGKPEPPQRHTPTGEFQFVSRVQDPTWHVPDSDWAEAIEKDTIGPGPENPLGRYWFGLDKPGYGLHGTNSPTWIGGAVSHGCVRLYPKDAERMYELVRVGMPIRIEYRPVRVGRDQEGRVYASVFPDVYDRVDLEEELRKTLRAHDIDPGLASQERIASLTGARAGRPQLLIGSEAVVRIGGADVRLDRPAVLRDGRLLVDAGLARELGLDVSWQDGVVTVGDGSRQARFALDGGGDHPAWRWGDDVLVGAKELLSSFDLAWSWSEADKALEVQAPLDASRAGE